MIWKIINAEESHIPHIAINMREEDKRELLAGSGNHPIDALTHSFKHSLLAWTCLIEDEPAFMWGVCPWQEPNPHGIPWLLSTPAIMRVSHEFVKQSRQYISQMLAPFPYLENYVHAKNHTSKRWLKWCGFEINKRTTLIRLTNESFYCFWMKNSEHNGFNPKRR